MFGLNNNMNFLAITRDVLSAYESTDFITQPLSGAEHDLVFMSSLFRINRGHCDDVGSKRSTRLSQLSSIASHLNASFQKLFLSTDGKIFIKITFTSLEPSCTRLAVKNI